MLLIIRRALQAIALIPIWMICTLAAWICLFCSRMSAWILHALAIILFLTAIGSAGFGLEPKSEVLKMMITSFVLFVIPLVAEELAAGLLILKYQVWSWIFG